MPVYKLVNGEGPEAITPRPATFGAVTIRLFGEGPEDAAVSYQFPQGWNGKNFETFKARLLAALDHVGNPTSRS